MESNSMQDFFDGPVRDENLPGENLEDLTTAEKVSLQSSDTDSESTVSDNNDVRVVELGITPPSSILNLLKDYVIVNIEEEEEESLVNSKIRRKRSTPYPRSGNGLRSTASVNVKATNDYALVNVKAYNTNQASDTCECDDNDTGNTGDAEDDQTRHVYIPRVSSYHSASESTISCYHDNDSERAGNDAASSDMDSENNDDDEQTDEEDYDSAGESYDEDAEPPNEGMISPARAARSRLSTLNSNMYKTDGEDLNDITISRSFAQLHKKEIVDAGAKTIGELFVSLKRKKAVEMAENTEDGAGPSSSYLIRKRNEENGKLKNKGKQKLPKSTIPFEEKHQGKMRQKTTAGESKTIKGKNRPSTQSSVTTCMNSEIHVEPEVSGDMGSPYPRAPLAIAASAESLTPESLTRLCGTETGRQSSPRNKSIDSQLMSDVDSRTGYISGRKNPQAKEKATIWEHSKSRIPLPVNKTGNCKKTMATDNTVKGHNKTPHRDKNRTFNSNEGKAKSTKEKSFQTHTIQLSNPEQFIAKGTTCTIDKKPPIPHQMKSVACYHNGKLDVSILGDRNILAKTDPLNVQITLLPQIKNDNRVSSTRVLPPLKNAPQAAVKYLKAPEVKLDETCKISKTCSQTKPAEYKIKQKKRNPRKRVKSTKQLPPLKRMVVKNTIRGVLNNTGWAPAKSRMEYKIRRDAVAKVPRPLPPIDRDIVHHRAQYPPFNTYTDSEASDRFQKIWCGFY